MPVIIKFTLILLIYTNLVTARQYVVNGKRIGCFNLNISLNDNLKECKNLKFYFYNSRNGGAEGEQLFSLSAKVKEKSLEDELLDLDIDKVKNVWRIIRIRVISSKFKLAKNLGVGSTAKDLYKVYVDKLKAENDFLIHKSLGLSFELDIPSEEYSSFLKTRIAPSRSVVKSIYITPLTLGE